MILNVAPLRLDTDRRIVTCMGRSRPLQPQLVTILAMLMERAGSIVTTEAVIDAFPRKWGERENALNTIRTRISKLRSILADIGAAGVIQTEQLSGYSIASGQRLHVYALDDEAAAEYEAWRAWHKRPVGSSRKIEQVGA